MLFHIAKKETKLLKDIEVLNTSIKELNTKIVNLVEKKN